MAILTAQEIIKQMKSEHIKIDKFNQDRIGPNSYDITLGNKVSYYALKDYSTFIEVDQSKFTITKSTPASECMNEVYKIGKNVPILDSAKENTMITEEIPKDGYIFFPGILYLVQCNEQFWSDKYVIEVSGTSGLARLGISVHKTAGYSNLGHEFRWILEIEVTHPVKVYRDMKIGQVFFHTIEGNNEVQYNGVYKDKQTTDNICGSLTYTEI